MELGERGRENFFFFLGKDVGMWDVGCGYG